MEKLDKLEQDSRELRTELKNLCENLKSITNMMKWFITTMGRALISFFFMQFNQKYLISKDENVVC
ncbi:hemolysin XhlA family protein [uncultured Clostridium sp.]|uniref:hemolysin XhlA family protein n=1 Tax=uncultured Clostridium sp. TaxID=59620 RepID=UPI0028E59A6A|nr:hemolysin XhlA family protein [uncultured Clostridium sp.]